MELISILTTYIAGAFGCAIILACIFYIGRKFAKVLAAPAFAAFYFMEYIFKPFKFKIPTKGTKRVIQEVCGMFCTLFSGQIIWLLIQHSQKNIPPDVMYAILHENIPFAYSALICICLIAILWISFTTKEESNDNEWFDKIMTLDFPKKINPF